MLSIYIDVEHKTWDTIVPYVTLAYNATVQRTTYFTHFQLVYGREAMKKLVAMLPHSTGVDHEDYDRVSISQRGEEACEVAQVETKQQ